MIQWEYEDARPNGFEYCQARWLNRYEISISKIGEKKYTVRLKDNGITIVKELLETETTDWKDAQSGGIIILQQYFNSKAQYWNTMSSSFTKWSEVE